MKCRNAKKLIFDFIDESLSDSEKVHLESHLRECQSCEAFASTMKQSLGMLRKLPPEEPQANFNWKVRLKLTKEREDLHKKFASQLNWAKRWNVRFALSAVTAFSAVLIGGYFIVSSFSVSTPQLAERSESVIPPHVATTDRTVAGSERLSRGTVYPSPYSNNFGGRMVSQGSPANPALTSPHRYIEYENPPLIQNPDSLVMEELRSMRMKRRIQNLEHQIDYLQNVLRQCKQKQ